MHHAFKKHNELCIFIMHSFMHLYKNSQTKFHAYVHVLSLQLCISFKNVDIKNNKNLVSWHSYIFKNMNFIKKNRRISYHLKKKKKKNFQTCIIYAFPKI